MFNCVTVLPFFLLQINKHVITACSNIFSLSSSYSPTSTRTRECSTGSSCTTRSQCPILGADCQRLEQGRGFGCLATHRRLAQGNRARAQDRDRCFPEAVDGHQVVWSQRGRTWSKWLEQEKQQCCRYLWTIAGDHFFKSTFISVQRSRAFALGALGYPAFHGRHRWMEGSL